MAAACLAVWCFAFVVWKRNAAWRKFLVALCLRLLFEMWQCKNDKIV
jgi:ketopantoate reductase